MAEPAGDETFNRGMEKARAALGQVAPLRRPGPGPRSVPGPASADDDEPAEDRRDARIAELEAEVRDLRAALARVLDTTRQALDP